MGQGRGGRFLGTFDVKMLFSSMLFFLEVALKYRPAATETEIKQGWHSLNTHLAVYGGG